VKSIPPIFCVAKTSSLWATAHPPRSVNSGLDGRKAIVIYGFDYPGLPMDPAIAAFEVLAARCVTLNARAVGEYSDLVHPVHRTGRVFGWEITKLTA
jgi:hypothetical protein